MSLLLNTPRTVRAPATSANLGPGFDSFGLALSAYDEVTAQVAGTGLHVDIVGEGQDTLARDERNLVVASLLAGLEQLGQRAPGLEVRCRNTIPQAKGLGSSAAAVVAGITLASALSAEAPLTPDRVLRLATALEGHPDNVAACLSGGFTISWRSGSTPRSVRLEPHESISPVLFVPERAAMSTPVARRLLPAAVPHGDAAANSAFAALLAVAITQRPELLLAATQDRLHQSYRRPAMADSLALLERLRDVGVPAVISGAGPAVLALVEPSGAFRMADGTAGTWRALRLPIDRVGAVVG